MKHAIRKAEPKYRRIQAAILGDVRERRLQPGSRIASERALCRKHDASLGTVQKALNQLVVDGVIERRHGSGTYLREPRGTVNRSGAGGFHDRRKTIRLKVDSAQPTQMAFWRASAERFAAHPPFVSVDVVTHAGATAEDGAYDLLECGQAIPTVQEDGGLIDLNTFSGGSILRLDTMPTPYLASIHMSVSCLLFNRTLLDKLGCPPPSATDFESQFAYIRSTVARANSVFDQQPITSCNLGPTTVLGSHAERLIERMRGKFTAADLEQLKTPVAQTLAYKELLLHGRRPADFNDADVFESGHSPIFPACSIRISALQHAQPTFEWGSHPFFSVDNAIPCVHLGVGICRSTVYPLECVRFIEHLQSPAEQLHMTQAGMVPVHPVDLSGVLLPQASFPPQVLQPLAKRLRPNRLAGAINHYLLESAIEAEFYQATSPKAFLKRAINLGKDYLRLTTPKQIRILLKDQPATRTFASMDAGGREPGAPRRLSPPFRRQASPGSSPR